MQDVAQQYLDAGLCVLPAIRAEKRPAVGAWKQYQTRLPTPAELSAWFEGGSKSPDAICILCGSVSGNVEILDFDAGGELFSAWWDRIPSDLRDKLVVEITPSGGYHVIYRCQVKICGNLKLAQREVEGKVVTLIETRGEGGLFLCAPTMGYMLAHGDLCHLPVLSENERDTLLQAAWELNEYAPEVVDGPRIATGGQVSPVSGSGCSDRPGDDYNARGDVRELLASHGWSLAQNGENEYWRRPGKTSGWSASLKICDGAPVFYVFSSNAAPFEANHGYSPFAVYTMLEHGGDFEQAARSLRQLGYGQRSSPATSPMGDVDLSGMIGQGSDSATAKDANAPTIKKLKTLIIEFTGLNPPVIYGLLREGETMNVIASPKVGKSWFVSRLAISIASGLDWLGLKVEPGQVLHIDNELHENTIAYRYKVLSEALNVPHHLYSGNIDMVSLRGQLRDLYALSETFAAIEPGQYKLIILDAFYRTLPRDTDENDNGAIANLYNLIDHYAGRLRCAFVLIHHTSKGNQAGKAVTDVGAGAGSQSRAADTHLILRPHEEDDVVVMESAVRSWPAMEPIALQRKWPLFIPTDEVDTSALLGVVKPSAKPKDVPLEEFVEQCVGLHDPCSKACVHYEAAQRFELPERKADQMLGLALERGDVVRLRIGARMKYVMRRPGVNGDKGLWTAAMLAHDPTVNAQDVADVVGVSKRYVNVVRKEMAASENVKDLKTGGNWVGTGGN